AIRRKLETEQSRKKTLTNAPVPGQTIAKRKSTAPKGTLAALRPSPAFTVPETISIAEASRLCATKRTNCVLVVDDEGGLSGIVTAKDIAYRVIAEGLDPRTTIVRQIMTHDPTVVHESFTTADALELMVSNKFRHLPVCSDDESVTGVVELTKVFYETLAAAQRKSSASEQLLNAMAGVSAELGSDGSNSEMLAWAAKLREKTALPDLSSVIVSHTLPATVIPKTSVRVVAQIMKESNASSVCVMEDAPLQAPGAARRSPRVVGILTSEDIVLRVIASGIDALHCSVVRVMTSRPETVRPTMSIHDAVKKMYDTQRSNIPILENDDRLLAVVNILSLAEASQEQIKAANQDIILPEATAESRPMLGRFLESIRSNTPKADSSEPFSPTEDLLLSPQSETSNTDSLAIADELSGMSMSMPSLTDISTPPTSAPPSLADAQSPREIFRDFQISPKTLFSPLLSPSLPDAGTYTYAFKFRAPSGMTHRVQARADDYKGLRDLVVSKLTTDPLFTTSTSTNVADPSLRPDPHDFHMLYTDDEGDDVAITDDSDVHHAVAASKKEGTDRVMLTIRGGSAWLVNESTSKPPATVTSPVITNETAVAMPPPPPPPPAALPIEPPKAEPADIQDAPPEYTPKSAAEEYSSRVGVAQASVPTQITAFNVQTYVEPVLTGPLDTLFKLRSTPDQEEMKMSSSPPPVSFPDEKGRPPAPALSGNTGGSGTRWEERAMLDKIRDLVTCLAAIFDDVDKYKRLLECQDAEAQKLIDAFQTLLDTPGLSSKFKRNLLVATQRLSRRAGLYPKCYNLEDIEMVEDHPVAAGSFADIYKGRFLGQSVCLKVIRVYQTSHVQSFLKQFSAEAVLWGQLSHVNLLPVYGLYRFSGRLCLVSPWMENGDISRFLKEHPTVTRASLFFYEASLNGGLQVLDVASGIAYLHDRDIVHGDLKGANILVDGCGRARLADFGLSAVTDSEILHWTANSSAGSRGGSVRWQAPELFDFENDEVIHNTTASDVYAFSCVAYEVHYHDPLVRDFH
ncbi:hypothetical protein C0991_007291, partial [Blastosporella zonata]